MLALLLGMFLSGRQADAAEGSKASPKSPAAKEVAVTVRVGRHHNYVRLVFETTDNYVQKASVILTGSNAVKVDFQSPVSFRTPQKGSQKNFTKIEKDSSKGKAPLELEKGLRIAVSENSCTITVDNLDDINVSKLFSPSRLVIDAYVSQSPADASSEKGSGNIPQESPVTAPDPSEIKFESFVIDAGHGGYDSGIHSGKSYEKDVALSFAKELAYTLARKNKKVFLTRKSDQILSIKDRIKASNQRSPEIFISIHISSRNEFAVYSAPKKTARPAEGDLWKRMDKNSTEAENKDRGGVIAQAIAQSMKSAFKLNVKVEKLPLWLIANVNAPAVLIELPNPEKFSYDGKTRERVINTILRGLAYSSLSQG
ncbi:MAG: N-acetylmuramoyl-L-alanine amidase [Nitrospirae bacterium]|nr:N-acetylmuramoyl-L-alanine amidase [Nitrospirota bacterium]